MAQQFLYDLHIFSIGVEQGGVGPPERVPTDLLLDAQPLHHGLDVIPHDRRQPDRLFTLFLASPIARGGEDEVVRLSIRGHLIPGEQISRRVGIKVYPFLGGLRLATADHLIDDGPLDLSIECLEVKVHPLDACQLPFAEATRHVKKDEYALAQFEIRDDGLDLLNFEDVRDPLPFRALANARSSHRPGDGIELNETPADGMVVENAQQVADLRLGSRRESLQFTRLGLHLSDLLSLEPRSAAEIAEPLFHHRRLDLIDPHLY